MLIDSNPIPGEPLRTDDWRVRGPLCLDPTADGTLAVLTAGGRGCLLLTRTWRLRRPATLVLEFGCDGLAELRCGLVDAHDTLRRGQRTPRGTGLAERMLATLAVPAGTWSGCGLSMAADPAHDGRLVVRSWRLVAVLP